jgi:hypothetical protein
MDTCYQGLVLFDRRTRQTVFILDLNENNMATKKIAAGKLTDAEKVALHMNAMDHPLKKETEALRKIIKNANPNLGERIKWNAPSYYYVEDIVTFGPVRTGRVLLVFHHPFVVKVKSKLLEGDYKDRRLVYFDSMSAVKSNKKELERIINEIIDAIDKKNK